MNLDRKRWLQLAQELKFSQLDIARKRAETWRNGLATMTTLLTGVLVIKGRSDFTALTMPFQIVVALLLSLALLTLLTATMWVIRALAGPTGKEFWPTGEDLEEWTRHEVGKIELALAWAPKLAAASVLVIGVAVAVTWFAPTRPSSLPPFVRVITSTGQQVCGAFVGASDHQLIVVPSSGSLLIPLSMVATLTPVTACP